MRYHTYLLPDATITQQLLLSKIELLQLQFAFSCEPFIKQECANLKFFVQRVTHRTGFNQLPATKFQKSKIITTHKIAGSNLKKIVQFQYIQI